MRTVRNDTQGAVMVIAVFMAMIVIGFLYYLVGLGDAILAQERMQDAADATAFSSAVIHARGMNVLALLNIIMAASMAILVLLSMVVTLLKLGAVVLGIAGIFAPVLWAGVTPLNNSANVVQTAERTAKKVVEPLIATLHKLQKPLRRAIPIIANVNAMKLARESYGPVVQAGITFPILSGLPSVDGEFRTLCEKAGNYAGIMATFPISAILDELGQPGEYLSGILESRAKSMGKAYALYYCGVGPKPSAASYTLDRHYPEIQSIAKTNCKNENISKERRESYCTEYKAELDAVKTDFDMKSGECRGAHKSDCEKIVNLARRDCDPTVYRNRKDYTWRVVTITRHFVLRGPANKQIVVEDEDLHKTIAKPDKADSVGVFSRADFCDTGIGRFGFDGGFGEWDANPTRPACTTDDEPPSLSDMVRDSDHKISKTHKEITHIFQCTQSETIEPPPLEDGGFSKGMKNQKPQEMCNCAIQGDELFQVRSVVYGDSKAFTNSSDKQILVATGGEKVELGGLANIASWSGKFAAAQAEYFYDGSEGRSEWLWHMNWKARMRRLQMRSGYECKVAKNNCPGEDSGAASSAARKKVDEIFKDAAATIISH